MRAHVILSIALGALAACTADTTVPVTPDAGVARPLPLAIVSFTASSTRAPAGEPVTLSYEVDTATSVVVSRLHAGAPIVLYAGPALLGRLGSGPIVESTTFEIRAWGGGKMVDRTLVVDARVPEVVIRSFTATPNPGNLGADVVIGWDVDSATRIRVLDDMTPLVDTSTRPAGQLRVRAVSGVRKLVLEAQNPWRTVTQALELRTFEPVRVVSFEPDPPTFGGASSFIRLGWDTRAESIRIEANGTPVPGISPRATTSTTTLRVAAPTLLELIAEGQGGSERVRRIATPDAVLELEPNSNRMDATPLRGGVVARVDGSSDVDYFRLTITAGAQLFVQLTDPRGKCLSGVTLRLLDTNGRALLVRTAGDNGGCVFIDPQTEPRVRALTGGEYYLVVESQQLVRYALAAMTRPAVCGNGVVESGAGEDCDDGGTSSGDGCSAMCTAEVIDTITLPGPAVLRASDLSAGQTDFYRLVVTQPVMATLETGAPVIGRCDTPGADTVLTVRDAARTVVGLSDDTLGLCAAFDGRQPLSLPAGSYLVAVKTFDPGRAIAAYELRVAGFEPRCGDGLLAAGEACDDGNRVGGDGCAADCTVEVLSGPGGRVPLDVPSGAVRVVDVELTRDGQSITATTSNGAGGCDVDTRLILSQGGVYLGYVTNGRGCATIDPRRDAFAADLSAGVYRIHVVGEGAAGGAVSLDVGVIEPACGNGIREGRAMEMCDDGNLVEDDGCTAMCQRVVGGTVIGPGGPPVVFGGAIGVAGDRQLYSLQLNAPGFLFVDVGIPVMGQCTQGDPVVEVEDAAMNTVVANDDAFGLCSIIDARNDASAYLAAGTYTIAVRSFDRVSSIPVFQVRVEVRAEGCGNEIVEANEVCDDGNVAAGDGCSPACVVEP